MVVHMLSDDVPLVISRQILQTLCQELQRLPSERHKGDGGFRSGEDQSASRFLRGAGERAP